MKKFNNVLMIIMSGIPKVFLTLLLLSIVWVTPTFADRSPEGCTGSGLNIFLDVSAPQVHIGDTILYGITVLNFTGAGLVVCDASDITASLVTPDGTNHPITLNGLHGTTLLSSQSDYYPDVVTYVARAQDVKPDGTLTATASAAGTIHQNDTNSNGSAYQGVNVTVINTPVPATLHVIKTVINDNGGTAVSSDFSLHVKNGGTDVSGSPAAGTSAPGTLYSLNAGTYTVSEDANSLYAQSFSGDCDSSGLVTLSPSENKTCTITNDDIVQVGVPTPPIQGNGTTASTIETPPTQDNGTISGGGGYYIRPVPPLIHVTKVPNPLSLSAGGGVVTYAYRVTNPGVVPLYNVSLTDDKCSPVKYVSGDTNGDAKLDTTEAWIYTCQSTLTKTTTNTVIAVGTANGMIVKDSAIATVVVASPGFPKTGFPPLEKSNLLNIIMLCITLGLPIFLCFFAKKRDV